MNIHGHHNIIERSRGGEPSDGRSEEHESGHARVRAHVDGLTVFAPRLGSRQTERCPGADRVSDDAHRRIDVAILRQGTVQAVYPRLQLRRGDGSRVEAFALWGDDMKSCAADGIDENGIASRISSCSWCEKNRGCAHDV